MVTRQILDLFIGVRVPASQPAQPQGTLLLTWIERKFDAKPDNVTISAPQLSATPIAEALGH